jgi:hypothetical protein
MKLHFDLSEIKEAFSNNSWYNFVVRASILLGGWSLIKN